MRQRSKVTEQSSCGDIGLGGIVLNTVRIRTVLRSSLTKSTVCGYRNPVLRGLADAQGRGPNICPASSGALSLPPLGWTVPRSLKFRVTSEELPMTPPVQTATAAKDAVRNRIRYAARSFLGVALPNR